MTNGKRSDHNKLPVDGVGCVIMASGLGKRFGGNKLMAELGGKPLIQWILDATEGIFSKRVVITRDAVLRQLCTQQGIEVILHELPGRNDTIRLGLEAVMSMAEECMFCPADQPFLSRDTIERLAFQAYEDKLSIWRPVFLNTVGAPVIFPQWTFEELLSLPEGKGGSVVIGRHKATEKYIPVSNPVELKDIDTKDDLKWAIEYIKG